MRTIHLKPGEQITIIAGDAKTSVANGTEKKRRGRAAGFKIPTSPFPSSDLHTPILLALRNGPKTSTQLVEQLSKNNPDITRNTVAWALVELQNSSRRRTRHPDHSGPVERTRTGEYRIRPGADVSEASAQ